MPAVNKELEAEIPYRFRLVRLHDITAVSGTGVVGWGALFPDGSVSLRWNTDTPSFANWDSMHHLIAVHGHGGATQIEWLDEPTESELLRMTLAARKMRRLV